MNAIVHHVKYLLMHPWFLWSLFFINLGGSIYGFYWYQDQLLSTEWYWLLFVPDSPMASTFFTGVLFCFLVGKRSPLLEVLAAITLLKYGVWAVVMIIWGGVLEEAPFLEALSWQHWMLIGSHLGMATQALLYIPFYIFKSGHVAVVVAWTLLNDLLDYAVDIHPWVAPPLEVYHWELGVFTVLLSGITILLFLIVALQNQKKHDHAHPDS